MHRWIVLSLVALIVIAHVFLWRSGMETGAKITFTLINVAGWAVILAPIFLVDRWLDTIKARNQRSDADKDVR